ncbi:triple QxxK/R motif-containing protein-like [Babylonia areolata]|uniref:triple QxxK/R motif-containing protein-like n=1 Tax=Babylonia areolata TaxID=304850 RepID=UPI003FCF4FE8
MRQFCWLRESRHSSVADLIKLLLCLKCGMARKDATGVQTPTDQYRKQIGKQDWKKSKKDIKAQKRAADQQTQPGSVGVLLVIITFLGAMGMLYALLVWYLNQSPPTLTGGHKAA